MYQKLGNYDFEDMGSLTLWVQVLHSVRGRNQAMLKSESHLYNRREAASSFAVAKIRFHLGDSLACKSTV
jgi:hypothetical protein